MCPPLDVSERETLSSRQACKSLFTPERLLSVRRGEVLSPTTILKTDHFYTGISNDLEHRILGAPNFRGVEPFDIYGVAQPTRPGLMTILKLLDCSPTGSRTKCVWLSTREEPLIYINDRPFVLRSIKRPFENIQTNTGIKPRDLEAQENRLLDDILDEASRSNGLIVIHDEKENGQIFPCLLSLDHVKTPRQIFEEFQEANYSISYHRLPLTPSQSPTVDFIDDVLTIIRQLDNDHTPLVFSCGMGLARTTLSMVIGLLIKRSLLLEKKLSDPLNKPVDADTVTRKSFVRLFQVVRRGIEKNTFLSSRLEQILNSALRESLEAVLQGNLILINDLTAALAHGSEVKRTVDRAIDECEHVLNIRESILQHRLDAEALAFSGNYSNANITSSLRTGAIFLERYFSLIAFGEFLEVRHLHPELRFSHWLASRKEVISMFRKIRPPGKTAEPRLTLFRPLQSISFKAILDRSASYGGQEASDDMTNQYSFPATPTSMAGSTVSLVSSADALVISNRNGRVLGPSRILKNDHWFSQPVGSQMAATCNAGELAVEPFNFRRMSSSLPIYGTSQPTRSSLDLIFTKILIEEALQAHHHMSGMFSANADIFDGLVDLPQTILQSLRDVSVQVEPSGSTKMAIQLPRIIWINLREEPVVYVGDEPYVLRDQYATLRNIRNYAGINRRNLESLEERLADDVRIEHDLYNGSLLLHHEESGPNGRLVSGQWHTVNVSNVQTPLSVFHENRIVQALRRAPLAAADGACDTAVECSDDLKELGIYYYRVPMTAEEAPELVDFDSIMSILQSHYPRRAAVLMNCQIGAGRSTIGMVISAMVLQGLYPDEFSSRAVSLTMLGGEVDSSERVDDVHVDRKTSRAHDCPAIRSLVRVLDKGTLSVERTDALLDLAAAQTKCSPDLGLSTKSDPSRRYGLKESIDRYRREAERAAPGSAEQTHAIRQGIQQLKRYFLLIAFQAYLFSEIVLSEGSAKVSELFSAWMKRHQEIMHMLEHQLGHHAGLSALVPEHQLSDQELLKRDAQGAIHLNLDAETVDAVLSKRNHNILQPGTILKQDHFPGCHLGQLAERIEGAPNFRSVTLYYNRSSRTNSPSWMSLKSNLTAAHDILYVDPETVDRDYPEQRRIYGVAIPTESAIRTVLDKVKAGLAVPPPSTASSSSSKEQQSQRRFIVWTSLREEPVLYIRGSPYVLRSIAAPYKNMEATGINRTRVLKMEQDMRDAARQELRAYQGNILLHAEELKDRIGHLVPIWETMDEEAILTPDDIFRKISAEGFSVDYDRFPMQVIDITDEQPPMPRIFDSIFERYRNLSQDSDAMFNCQMGRGRTTTGMIISSLIEVILHRARFMPFAVVVVTAAASEETKVPHVASDRVTPSEAQKTKYLSGQYLLIDSLVRVLGYGKLAKYLTDVCIDNMDQIQNLRTAIYSYKVKIESKFSPDAHDFEIALQYLVRYFYLITFTNYLLEREAEVGREPWKPFSEWLENRKEVTSLVREKLHEVDFS